MNFVADEDVFADESALQNDLGLLETLRVARKDFSDQVCERCAVQDEKVLATLRQEATYQLAEFLYLIRARRIVSVDQVQMLCDLHNQYIVDLTKDPSKSARLGLGTDRLLQAIFTADTLPRLLHHWAESPGTFDQSNLARFLAVLMSTETCRKVVVACSTAGFITRSKSPYGAMLLRSNGTLELLFGACLRDLRRRIP